MIINGKKYVTEKEMAARCELSVAWFRRARYEQKEFPHYILNRKVYYIEHEVDEWLQQKIAPRM